MSPRVSRPPPRRPRSTTRYGSCAAGPGDEPLTAQGHPRTVFKRAIERGSYLVAVTTAREVGRLDLAEALELLNLIALHEPALYDRAARRWLARLLDERQDVTVLDLQLAAAALAALPTASHDGALAVLRVVAGRQVPSGH